MNNGRQTQPQAPGGINVGDIYYVLFRHKWKIVLLSLAGIAAAAALYHFKPPPYQSQAELLVQYVPTAPALSVVGSDQRVIVPDTQGPSIINSEIRILTSFDLAEEAATNIGPAKILAKIGGGNNALAAAGVIQGNLQAVPADNGSSVIVVTFKHPDPEIVQPVLREIMGDYMERQKELHSQFGEYDTAISREITTLSVRLNDTDKQIADLKNRANIISLDDARKTLATQFSQIKSAMSDAQAALAGYEAAMKQAGTAAPETVEVTNKPVVIPSEKIDAYNSICSVLDALRKKEQGYLLQGFTKSNAWVIDVDEQLASTLKAKEELEKKYPQLAGLGAVSPASDGQTGTAPVDLRAQIAQVASLRAKLKDWRVQMEQLQMEATNLNNLGPILSQLEQQRANQQASLQILSEGLERSHLNAAIEDSSKAPNIKPVQSPTPPFQDWKKTHKKMAMLVIGGLLAGLAWAFLTEFILDRSVRRPIEIESKLKVPLFLSIPNISRNGQAHLAASAERRRLQLNNGNQSAGEQQRAGGSGPVAEKNSALQVVSLEHDSVLQPFCEALRDRLIVYFEVKNLTHKPKLVALTSAGRGAGVSTLAAGLAASLSETGDGNVLLVDMNQEGGAAQQFYKGKAGCGLETALKADTKQNALVQENLYVVNGNANTSELPRVLPKRFASLVPKLKASDYDYIIFDMPPVSQTSLTSRLARFMDMTLLVVESEKTGREVVEQAKNWLAESGATVGAVLNKTRRYVPERLHQEFLGNK